MENEPPHIGTTLDPVRAAISLVADGLARRVTINVPSPAAIMPAARQLARAAGVRVELVDDPARHSELEVRSGTARGA
jgi:hypothetical protein